MIHRLKAAQHSKEDWEPDSASVTLLYAHYDAFNAPDLKVTVCAFLPEQAVCTRYALTSACSVTGKLPLFLWSGVRSMSNVDRSSAEFAMRASP